MNRHTLSTHMNRGILVSLVALCVLTALYGSPARSEALYCEISEPHNDPGAGYSDHVYLADCAIETDDAVPFVIKPGDDGKFVGELYIRLNPGFHAQAGSHFRARLRDCVRNPAPGTGYAAFGSEETCEIEDPPHPCVWQKEIAARFVANFNQDPNLVVEHKYDTWPTGDLPPGTATRIFYQDATLVPDGRDDFRVGGSQHGIDEGVFFFNVTHGSGVQRFHTRGDPPTYVYADDVPPHEMLLGNCSSDEGETGELRYLWMCSCKTFAHGPSIRRFTGWDPDPPFGPKFSLECDRPSNFVPGTTDGENHRNLVARWGPVLSENMRMACGISTNGTCSGNDEHHLVMDRLWENYDADAPQGNLSVADSWGQATAGFMKGAAYQGTGTPDNPPNPIERYVRTTPICIARGNYDGTGFRSPISEDHRFTSKANPYDEAFHIVSWESDDQVGQNGIYDDWDVVHQMVPPSTVLPTSLPVLITRPQAPPADLSVEDFDIRDDTMISRQTTLDGRPRTRIDTRTGAISLARDKKLLRADDAVRSSEDYLADAKRFIQEQGWTEEGMGGVRAVRSVLQVIPDDYEAHPSSIVKVLRDITVTVRRRISIDDTPVKVFGRDNEIVLQMNNDGSILNASKQWQELDSQVEGIPLKSVSEAQVEALGRLESPDLYEMSEFDWGYQSTVDDCGQQMMLVHYYFTFEPNTAFEGAAAERRVVEIQGHIVESGCL